MHCILKANHKDNKWQGNLIKKGSFITSLKTLSLETGISTQSIRTILKRLETTKEIIVKSTNKNRVITICNYDSYQEINNDANKQLTNNQQTTNKQLTTNKNDKNVNNDKEDVVYDTNTFINDFNKHRKKFMDIDADMVLKNNERYAFEQLLKTYSKQDFRDAISGLFKYSTLDSCKRRPFWILEEANFLEMRDCFRNGTNPFKQKQVI